MANDKGREKTEPSSAKDLDAAGAAWRAIDRFLEAAGDRLNPILVKETRQALKSRQFILWFVLLLVACWITTIAGVVLIGPGIYYVSAGKTLLYAYYFILALPLAVVVPFSAYRSLSSEQEENTRDLLEVSSLTPRQVINGKLGSAALQMIVYLSALAPCIAFTYLLRGVDVATILLVLAYAVFACIGLSAIGLLVAAATRHRQQQVFLSVLLAAGLFASFSVLLTAATAVMQIDARERAEEWFGYVHAAFLSLYLTTIAIVYLAASGLSTFASANRSTPLRLALVAQQTVYVAWVAGLWFGATIDDGDFLIAAFMVTAAYWFLAGAVMTGEGPVMSHRVRRTLPKSLVGRTLLTWFNPGPGSGYIFVVANLGLIVLLTCAAAVVKPPARGPAPEMIAAVAALTWGYTVTFLGLGRLTILGLRRLAPLSLFGCFLVNLLLLLGGSSLPFIVETFTNRRSTAAMGFFQSPSPAWTIARLVNGQTQTDQVATLLIAMIAIAGAALVVNLRLAGREARQLRVARPRRVVEDDLLLNPMPESRPTSPWGDTAKPASLGEEG